MIDNILNKWSSLAYSCIRLGREENAANEWRVEESVRFTRPNVE